ncbi:MAG TPA: sulfatase-like hydrolase/transferase, partial [Candidatus Binatia bacterium]|nr:sulfatase-like hydrolase/transferase [Candidatus Binatia bacterium]
MTRALALLGAALAATLAAATGVALRAVAPQGWWAAGYHRLVVDAVVARFDPAALAVGGVGLALAAAAALLARRRPARRTRRAGGTPTALGLAALGAVVGLRAAVALDAWRAAADGPNVLLVSIDTLRADRLGAYGYARPTSPTLDGALAARGVLFEDAYSQSPKTTPSHMTMLTSLYPSVHGVTMWEEGKAGPVLAP